MFDFDTENPEIDLLAVARLQIRTASPGLPLLGFKVNIVELLTAIDASPNDSRDRSVL